MAATDTAACLAIKAEARRLGWPTHWKTDLVADIRALRKKAAPETFGWAIRAAGTELFRPGSIGAITWLSAAITVREPGQQRYYHWNGTTLVPIEPEQLIRLLLGTVDRQHYVALRKRAYEAAEGTRCACRLNRLDSRAGEFMIQHRERQQIVQRAEEQLLEYDRLFALYSIE